MENFPLNGPEKRLWFIVQQEEAKLEGDAGEGPGRGIRRLKANFTGYHIN